MKQICFFLSQLFTDLFKKKKKYRAQYIIPDSIEMSNLSSFNLEKHDNTFNRKNTYKPPSILKKDMVIKSEEPPLIDFESSSSEEEELFKSYSQNKFKIS